MNARAGGATGCPAAPPHAVRGRAAGGAPPGERLGGWRPGDPAGRRIFRDVGELACERGGVLPRVSVAYETWGSPSPARDNAILVLHALTGDSHAAGPAAPGHPMPGWWDALIGPGRALDTTRWWVVCPNVLGGCQGTTGPSSPGPRGRAWGSAFPRVTVRDQVEVERRLADALGIERWALVIGGSMGGMRALEWAVTAPERVCRLALIATTAAASADQIAFTMPQLEAIRADPAWRGGDFHPAPGSDGPSADGPYTGLGIARRIAHLTYRSAAELEERFGRGGQDATDPLDGGRWAVQSYLDHHADKLARRFDPGSYVVLTEAMNGHDVGRGRGGVEAALARVRAETVVVGVDSDRLYPLHQQVRLARHISSAADVHVVRSPYGHDGFLVEAEQVGKPVADLLR